MITLPCNSSSLNLLKHNRYTSFAKRYKEPRSFIDFLACVGLFLLFTPKTELFTLN